MYISLQGLNLGTLMKKPAQHCTNGAAWSFFLLTGKDYRRFSNKDVVAIGGEAKDKNKELQKFKTGPLKKEGVYWGRVCNGNKNGKSPVDNPEGCFHSFSMTIGDNGVAIYQTMQAAFAMDHEFGIKRYPKDKFAEKISIATTETTRTGRNKEFHEIFWYEPGEEHSLEETGAPQVILNGPFPDKCSEIPKLAEFDFVRGKHNWGEKVFHPNQHKVDWPITKIHSKDTMGEGGVAEGGWMKNWFCNCYEEAEKAKKLCSIL